MRKRVEITVETHEVMAIRRAGKSVLAWCPVCGNHARMITPEEAAVLESVNTRTVYRWVEEGSIHSAETAEGFLQICPESLSFRSISRGTAREPAAKP